MLAIYLVSVIVWGVTMTPLPKSSVAPGRKFFPSIVTVKVPVPELGSILPMIGGGAVIVNASDSQAYCPSGFWTTTIYLQSAVALRVNVRMNFAAIVVPIVPAGGCAVILPAKPSSGFSAEMSDMLAPG
jgi:hypothetical protein